jgi:hypothetical protein
MSENGKPDPRVASGRQDIDTRYLGTDIDRSSEQPATGTVDGTQPRPGSVHSNECDIPLDGAFASLGPHHIHGYDPPSQLLGEHGNGEKTTGELAHHPGAVL